MIDTRPQRPSRALTKECTLLSPTGASRFKIDVIYEQR